MQLLKSETPIKAQCNKDIIERIKAYATDKHDIKYQHTTTARGYVKRNKNIAYLCLYTGRFGVGITYYTENYMSTNYCFKTTISWKDMTVLEMFTILRKAFREFHEEVNCSFIIKVVSQNYEL